jgi:hypothetical protein
LLEALAGGGMFTPFMQKAPSAPAARSSHLSGAHRLILAGSAAGALATLCWAALKVREANAENGQLRERLAKIPQHVPPPGSDARLAESNRRAAEAEAQRKQTSEQAAAREKELNGVIAFLRQEIAAAQQTIDRLKNAPPSGDAPDAVEVKSPAQSNSPSGKRTR